MAKSKRSDLSRRSLIAAASEVISDRGIQGIRVREVAAKAGMSPAAVLYHYPDNADLLLAVHRAVVEDYLDLRRCTTNGVSDPRQQLTRVFESGIPALTQSTAIRLLYELHGLARQDAAHAALMTSLWTLEVSMYVEIIEAGIAAGVFKPSRPVEDIAVSLLGLEDGLALHLTSENDALSSSGTLRSLHLVAASLLGCEPWDHT